MYWPGANPKSVAGVEHVARKPIAGLGMAGFSVFATLGRLGGDIERAFHKAPALPAAAFAEGAYGRIRGVATSSATLPVIPGLGELCLLYEIVVYESTPARG